MTAPLAGCGAGGTSATEAATALPAGVTVAVTQLRSDVADRQVALQEFLRVTRPGGRLVICEFSDPVVPGFRTVYKNYLMAALPRIARRISSNPDSYVYLAESIQAWPGQRELATDIADAGWQGVEWTNLSAGIVALHRATKPVG